MGKTRVATMEQLPAGFFRTRKIIQPYPLASASCSSAFST